MEKRETWASLRDCSRHYFDVSHTHILWKKQVGIFKPAIQRRSTCRVLTVSRAQQQQGDWLGLHLHYANVMKAGSQWRLVALDRCRDTTTIMKISSTVDHSNKMTLISEMQTSRDRPLQRQVTSGCWTSLWSFQNRFHRDSQSQSDLVPSSLGSEHWGDGVGAKAHHSRGNIRGRKRRGPLKKGKQRETWISIPMLPV